MKAIKVSFLQATATRSFRLRATDGEGHSLTEPYDYVDADEQAFELAKKLIKNWSGNPTLWKWGVSKMNGSLCKF